MIRSRQALYLASVAVVAATGCQPSTVPEAEAKGDVAWLDQEGSPSAILALGRVADKSPSAATILQGRAKFDVTAYIAAWAGVKRGAAWATDLLHDGLRDPTRAESAASAVEGKDPAVVPFLPDVEGSMSRLAAGGQTSTLAAVLAAAGPPAHDAVVRRLAEKTTRGAMCGGIAVASASADARTTLRSVPPASRDDEACVGAVTMLASTDETTMKWLAQDAEPGLLGAASKLPTIDCGRLQTMWTAAMTARPPLLGSGIAVPLSYAVNRCPPAMDGVLANAIKTKPESQAIVLAAIDPFSPDDAALKATCAVLPLVVSGKATGVTKERASDALAHGCRSGP